MDGIVVIVFCGLGTGGDVGSFLGFHVGRDFGSSVPDAVGATVEGKLVEGAIVFGFAVGLFCGSFVGESDVGKLVKGAAYEGDWLVGADCG